MNCRICGSATTDSFLLVAPEDASLVRAFHCRRCSAYFTNPPSASYDDWDGVGYYLGHAAYIQERHEKLFAFVETLTGGSRRFLDIGAGLGLSLKVGIARGWKARGIEPNKTLAAYAERELGLNVIHGYFGRGSASMQLLRDDSYEYILIDNVLEHIHRPVEFLQDAESLLSRGGLMVVAVPPVDWLRRLLAQSAFIRNRVTYASINAFYSPIQHVNFFSRRAFEILTATHLQAKLLPVRFHHHWLLDNAVAAIAGIFTGYCFLRKP